MHSAILSDLKERVPSRLGEPLLHSLPGSSVRNDSIFTDCLFPACQTLKKKQALPHFMEGVYIDEIGRGMPILGNQDFFAIGSQAGNDIASLSFQRAYDRDLHGENVFLLRLGYKVT